MPNADDRSLFSFVHQARCRLLGHRWDPSDAQVEWCYRCGSGRLGRAYREAAKVLALGAKRV